MPGRLFKITAKRRGKGRGRLSEGRRLLKEGTYQVFLSKKCNFESTKSFYKSKVNINGLSCVKTSVP